MFRAGTMRDKNTVPKPDGIQADFVKIFSGALGTGLVIFGYSYTYTFFQNFSIPLFQLDMEWIDIFFHGIVLIQRIDVAVAFLMAILLGSLFFAYRNRFGSTIKVLVGSVVVFGLLLLVIWGGRLLGSDDAQDIWLHGKGSVAFCEIDDSHPELAPLVGKIKNLSLQQRIRLIYQSPDRTYLAPVLGEVAKDQNAGEVYVIPTKYVRYCRIIIIGDDG